MPDVIYPRLFLEVIPEELKNTQPDIKKLIHTQNNDEELRSIYGKIIGSVYKQNPHSNIGLEFGTYLEPQSMCDVARMLASSINLDSAIHAIANIFHLHNASYYPSLYLSEERCSISLTFPFKTSTSEFQRRFCLEAGYSFLINMVRLSASPDFTLLRACFDFPKPKYAHEYPQVFGKNIIFDAPISMIEFDSSYLSMRFNTSNPTVNKVYLKKNLDEWHTKKTTINFDQQVVTLMLKYHPESFNCLSLAKLMNLSVRGLQKRLSKNNVTFSELSNRARKELTKIYFIQEKRSINWTADKLGFQSRSGFSRYFKMEFNQSPAEFINTHADM